MMWRRRGAARHAPIIPEAARQARSQPQIQFTGSADKSRAVRRAGRPTAEERPFTREYHHKKREKADHPLTKSANPLQAWPQPQPELVDSLDKLWNLRRAKGSTQSHLREAISSELLAHLEDSEKIRVLAGLLVNTAIPRRAQRILLIAHDLGIPLKLNAFEAVAYQLAETAQWDHMSSLVSLARRICGRTSTRLQNWRARALIEVSHFDLLDHVLHDFEEESIQPTRRTFHIILSGHLQNRNLAKAKECLSRMERAGHKMDASTHAIIARAYRSLGTDRAVVAGALKALPELTGTSATAVLNSLLQLALDADDLDTALGYLNFFDTHPAGDILGPTGDNITLPAGEDPVPITSTIVPDVATFTIIINYLAKRRNFPLAMQMLERMKASGICPDSVLAAAVIRVHCAVGDIQSALRMTARMCENVPRARAIFQWLGMRGKGHDLIPGNIPVTIDVLNALLRGVLAHVGVEGMRGMYDLMRAAGVKPNAETVAVFLAHLERVEQASPHYLLVLLNKFSRTIPPTLQHIHIIFRAVHARERSAMQRRGWWSLWAKLRGDKYLRESEPWWIMPGSQEHDATGKIREIQPFPVDHTYARLLEPILRSLESRNIQADRAIVHLRMRREVVIKRNVEEAEAFLQAMLDRGMRVTPYHISTIMQGYVLRDDVAQAERIFRSSGAAGIRPSVILYTILIAGYAQRGIPGQALRVFRDMINAGISPDVGSIDALASAWFAVGAFAMARQVLIQMWPHVAPFPEDFRMRSTHFLHDITRLA